MALTPADIIEVVIDELVTSDVADDIPNARVMRTGDGSLLLDYGEAGRFTLTVEPARP